MFSIKKQKEIELQFILPLGKKINDVLKTPFNGYCLDIYFEPHIYFLNFTKKKISTVINELKKWCIENKQISPVFITSSYYGKMEEKIIEKMIAKKYRIKNKTARMFFNDDFIWPTIECDVDVNIKEMKMNSLDFIDTFRKSFFTEVNNLSEEYIKEMEEEEQSPQRKSFVMYDGSQPIGIISLDCKDEISIIGNVGIIPEYQGRNLGILLMEKTIEFNKKNGNKLFALDALMGEKNFIYFYRKCGFDIGYILTRWKK